MSQKSPPLTSTAQQSGAGPGTGASPGAARDSAARDSAARGSAARDSTWTEGGGVTSPLGWRADGVYTRVKTYGSEPRLDLGVLVSDLPASVAGVFTTNAVVGAPVTVCRGRVASGRARGVVVNSGCSNVATGERGRQDALRMTELAARQVGVPAEEMLVASTGVIGRLLPMDKLAEGMLRLAPRRDGQDAFARAIMTTDRRPKSRALRVRVGSRVYTVGGCIKGAGMIHPDMATMLCFLTTDAPVAAPWLDAALRRAAEVSLNMIDVDMDTSTSDTLLLFANGAAGGEPIDAGHPAAEPLGAALATLCTELGRDLVRDAEGASTLIEVTVRGAASQQDARRAARTVVSSPLVKTMVTGRDPNLGRVMMAIGRSGARVDVERVSVWIGDGCAFERGSPTALDLAVISAAMHAPEVRISVDLGLGTESATAWGCDLTEEYVRINASYTT